LSRKLNASFRFIGADVSFEVLVFPADTR